MDEPSLFSRSTLPSTTTPLTLSLYQWLPAAPHCAVFLLHGFRSHTRFNFLLNTPPRTLHQYGTAAAPSLIRLLNASHCAVFAHDYIGHGESTGTRAYFPSMDAVVEDVLMHIHFIKRKFSWTHMPLFLLGHSMGGTVAILTALKHPIFRGIALSSPATEPPQNMFGFWGRVQKGLSALTSAVIPTAQLITLPRSSDEKLQRLFEADPLNASEGLRARVGRQFLLAYQYVAEQAPRFVTPLFIVSGELDTLVDPGAARRFFENVASQDKTVEMAKGRWHNLLVEDGKEQIWQMYVNWIVDRMHKKEVNNEANVANVANVV